MRMADIETYRVMFQTPDPEMRRVVRKAFCHRFRSEPFLDAGWDAVSLSRLGEAPTLPEATAAKRVRVIKCEGGEMRFPSIKHAAAYYGVNVNTITKWAKRKHPGKGCHDIIMLEVKS